VDYTDTKFMEHMAAKSPLSLEQLCEVAQRALDLPEFDCDAENETEWGISVKDSVEYNISRPYKEATLRTWDPTVPEGFNIGLILIFREGSALPSSTSDALVQHVAQTLAVALSTPIAHHRTWLGVGNSVPRHALFLPRPSDA
jgi:hypothetical protein